MGTKGIDITVTACVNKRGPKKKIESDKVIKKNKKNVPDKKIKKEKNKVPEKKKRNKKDKSSESFIETENTKI